jgi:hypothetical protein
LDLEGLVNVLKEKNVWVDSSRDDVNRYGTVCKFENPKVYPFGFDLYFCLDSKKQKESIFGAINRSLFAFDKYVILLINDKGRLDKNIRRYCLSVSCVDADGAAKTEIADQFTSTLIEEIKNPYGSEALKEAILKMPEGIIKDMCKKSPQVKNIVDKERNNANGVVCSDDNTMASCSC